MPWHCLNLIDFCASMLFFPDLRKILIVLIAFFQQSFAGLQYLPMRPCETSWFISMIGSSIKSFLAWRYLGKLQTMFLVLGLSFPCSFWGEMIGKGSFLLSISSFLLSVQFHNRDRLSILWFHIFPLFFRFYFALGLGFKTKNPNFQTIIDSIVYWMTKPDWFMAGQPRLFLEVLTRPENSNSSPFLFSMTWSLLFFFRTCIGYFRNNVNVKPALFLPQECD
jgi:hypothetical protein